MSSTLIIFIIKGKGLVLFKGNDFHHSWSGVNRKTAFEDPFLCQLRCYRIRWTFYAGGSERGGYNIDQLFNPERFATEAIIIYVMHNRKKNNVNDLPVGSVFAL